MEYQHSVVYQHPDNASQIASSYKLAAGRLVANKREQALTAEVKRCASI